MMAAIFSLRVLLAFSAAACWAGARLLESGNVFLGCCWIAAGSIVMLQAALELAAALDAREVQP